MSSLNNRKNKVVFSSTHWRWIFKLNKNFKLIASKNWWLMFAGINFKRERNNESVSSLKVLGIIQIGVLEKKPRPLPAFTAAQGRPAAAAAVSLLFFYPSRQSVLSSSQNVHWNALVFLSLLIIFEKNGQHCLYFTFLPALVRPLACQVVGIS